MTPISLLNACFSDQVVTSIRAMRGSAFSVLIELLTLVVKYRLWPNQRLRSEIP